MCNHIGRCLIGVLAIAASTTWAQEPGATYPNRAIRLVVPYTPGGSADVLARALGQQLSITFKQPVVIDNKAGADGLIGAEVVAKSRPDGYTVLYGPNALYSIFPYLHPKASTNTRRDLEPVAMVASAPLVLAVNNALPVKSVAELIAYAKARPEAVSYGSSGNTSLHHITGESFTMLAGIKMVHVPYKGTSQAATDLAGGSIQVLYGNLSSIQPLVTAQKARVLAVTSDTRFAGLPDVPSIGETLKGWGDFSTFQGIFAPKGTPAAIMEKISSGITQALNSPEFRAQLQANAFAANPGTGAQFKARLERDYENMGKIIKAANIHPDEE